MSEDRQYRKDGTYTAMGPNGRRIVYNPDGTPCRPCNTLSDFRSANMLKSGGFGATFGAAAGATNAKSNSSSNTTDPTTSVNDSETLPNDCPPDVTQLGNSTWTLLHSIAAKFPTNPTTKQQQDLKGFVSTFAQLYPCSFCAEDFRDYLNTNEVNVASQDDFGKWLCRAHNSVNVKLGKPEFDCQLWKQRWKDGWEDGRCD